MAEVMELTGTQVGDEPADGGWVVQTDEEDYGLMAPDGEEGELAPYGQAATLAWEGDVYLCWITDPDEREPVLYRVPGGNGMPEVVEAEVEEVKFVGEGFGPDHEGEDKGEDEDEDEDKGLQDGETVNIVPEEDEDEDLPPA